MFNRVLIDQTTNTVNTDQCPEIHNSVVVNNEIPSNIDVIENVTNIITVTVPGPQGAQGTAGSGGTGDISGSNYFIPVFSGSTALVTSSIFQSGSFTSIRNAISPEDPTNPDILYVNGDGVDTYNLISAHGNRNSYVQLNVQNYNNSTEASSDIVATADNGDESSNYIDMGINSSGFTNTGNVGGENDAYVYSTGNDLYIGNASSGKQIIIFNGGLDAENQAKVWIHDQGTVGINTDTYNTVNPPSLQVNAPNDTTYNIAQFFGNTDNYAQVGITNANIGATASADLVLYNNIDYENQLAGFVDLGINSTNYVYNGIYPGSAGDAYLFTDSEHLVIGSVSASNNAKITLFAGGINESDNAKLILYGSNQHQMTGSLNVSGSVTAQSFTGSLLGTSSNVLGGQNNYIPLWSGSTSLTSSILYQNGSLLGINNPSPSRTLDLISLQSGSYVSVASFMAPNNNIVGNTTQFYLGAQQATGNSISWTFNYQGNNSVANRMGFEFNGYATPVLSMFRNGNSVFGGAVDNGFKHDVQGTGRYTNNLTVTGSVTATTGFTGSLFGTSSWALNAITASWATNAISSSYPIAVSGSTLYSTNPAAGVPTTQYALLNSIFLGNSAGSGSDSSYANFLGYQAGLYTPLADYSNFIGNQAGFRATNSDYSNFIGNQAGYSASVADQSNFIGSQAGYEATTANDSNFIGTSAGFRATNARYSNFIGWSAGANSTQANSSNFIGYNAGTQAVSASISNFIGYNAGYLNTNASYSIFIGYNAGSSFSSPLLGANNILIGTNITLPAGRRDSLNIAGIIFGTGSYFNQGLTAFSGTSNGKIGINVVNPVYTLDVSGSGNYTTGLTVTGSLIAPTITGSLQGTASWALNAITASYALNISGTIANAISSSYPISVTGSTLYSVKPAAHVPDPAQSSDSIFFGNRAGFQTTNTSDSNFIGQYAGYTASNANSSNFIGAFAGYGATNANTANFIGFSAGQNAREAYESVFIGPSAGNSAVSASDAVFIGSSAGGNSTNGTLSNFVGFNAGVDATNASSSNFIGVYAGQQSINAYESNFIGTYAGRIASTAYQSNFIGTNAGRSATNANNSNFFGTNAGYQATQAAESNFLGNSSGYQATLANYSNFLGSYAGYQATTASFSNFIGASAGNVAGKASYSNFLGYYAGNYATTADNSNFFGAFAGDTAKSASYSTLIGYKVGYNAFNTSGIGSNNIIIGTNITLTDGRKDSINLGAIIFATGSYSTTSGVPFTGTSNGRVGINQPLPIHSLDVSGSGRYTNGLTVTGSLIAPTITGSLFGTASWALNALTASFGGNFTASNALINGTITAQTLVVQTVTSSIVYSSGSNIFGNNLTNTQVLTGSVSITGSLTVNGSSPIFASQTSSMTVASSSFATTASYALTASYVSGSSTTSVTASYAFTSSYATSFIVSGTLNVGKTNIEFQENTNVTTGTWRVVSSEPTASYRAAFFDYVMFSGSVGRAGTVYSIWSASYAEYYENYTGDVGGSTSGVTLQAAISGSNIQLQATASNNAWTIRSLVRML